MRKCFLFLMILCCNSAFSQLNDSFADGNFTASPAWGGDVAAFSVNSNKQLQPLIGLSPSTITLSTANTLGVNVKWEFYLKISLNPSANNFVRIYLMSDNSDLKGSLNGYFIQVGENGNADSFDLYLQNGTTITKIIDGRDNLASTIPIARIQVTRSTSGQWELKSDITGGTNFTSEGTVSNNIFNSASWFGIYCKYSTGNSDKFIFDDFKIEQLVTDQTPPKLSSVSSIDSITLEAVFDEALDSLTAKVVTNYSLNNSYGNPLSISTTADPVKYRLKYQTSLNTSTYTLTVSNIKDKNNNLISGNNTASFTYIKPYTAKKNDLVINEIFADPSPQIDLPSVEFTELLNTTSQTIYLHNWKYGDASTISNLPGDSIRAGEFIILCAKTDTNEFKRFGKVIGISPWPSLNNSGDVLKLISPENKIIDSVSYTDSWYKDGVKKSGGWTLERIDPISICQGVFNWSAGMDISGGSPGRQNSMYMANYDQITLKADSLKQLSDSTIQVFFNKHIDVTTIESNKFNINPSAGNILSISFDSECRQAILKFNYKFSPNNLYVLNISSISDCSGNIITTANQPLHFQTPALPPVAPVRLDTAKIFITEIFADPSPEVGLPLVEFVEIYNPGIDTIDLDGWTFNDPGTKATIKKIKILPREYLIMCPAADTAHYKPFGRTAGLSPWPSLNNASDQIVLKSFKGRISDSVTYLDSWYKDLLKKQGGWTLERVDIKSVCPGLFNWSAGNDHAGGTPGRLNSLYQVNYDQLPFKADSLKQFSDSTIRLFFNKHVDATTLQNNKFNLNPQPGYLLSLSFEPEYRQAILTYSSKFSPNTKYDLNISGITDCSGNNITSTNQPLHFQTAALSPAVPVPPERLDTAKVFITEIFADPSPEVGLPLAEFVEIFNPGRDTIDLDGWTFNDPGTYTVIKKVKIRPNEYLILCPAADTTHYKPFGKTAGISPWPSLNNGSDQIVLKSFRGRISDSISYADSWYKDQIKKQGGWTLERIDPMSICQGLLNWSSSRDKAGGTPGKQNSIYHNNYDKAALIADSLKQISDSTILVFFNKYLDINTVQANKFNLSPELGNILKVSIDNDSRLVTLTYSQKFILNTEYKLTISSIADCSGNLITSSNQPMHFKTPALPPVAPVRLDTAKIFITEIFADPSPEVGLPLVEFIEIYNPGKDTINLDGWTLNDTETKATIRKAKIQPHAYLILCPATDTLQFKTFGKTAGISPWPSLNNSSDVVILKSFNSRIVDSISYFDTWHKDPVKKQGGWTLERIDIYSICQGLYNWGSSFSTTGGTPGSRNSNYQLNYDKLLFKADTLKQISDSSIRIFLSKQVELATVQPHNFYLTPSSGQILNIHLDQEYKQITLTYTNKFNSNTLYALGMSISDCSGNTLSRNQALHFKTKVLPPMPQVPLDTASIYITEIFADPSPEVGLPLAEFIELYNPGKDTINLDGWTFNDPLTKATIKKVKILPNEYLILCPAADTVDYKTFGKTAGISPWPSLNNTSDQIVLKSFRNRKVDSISYSESWYKDIIKRKGGWALERIEINAEYDGFYYWGASKSISGGTPGKENSIKKTYTNKFLAIDTILITSDSTLQVMLNNIPDTSFIKASYFDLGLAGKAVKATLGNNYRQISLQFNKAFETDIIYTLKIDSLRTCSGVFISMASNQMSFTIPGTPELEYKIIINEIFADTSPVIGLPDVEFIELYNPTDTIIGLKGLSYEDGSATKFTFSKGQIRPGGYLILCPEKDTLYYKPFGQVMGLAPWPSLNNDKDILILRNNMRKEIHRVSYNNSWYKNKEKQEGGWSLELIDPQTVCSGLQNWSASKYPEGGTPGKQNSVYKMYLTNDHLKLIGAILIDSITLELNFNRPVDSISSSLARNFILNNGAGNPDAVLPVGPNFEQVLLKFSRGLMRGNTYKITVGNLIDCAGIIISDAANSVEFMYPEKITKNDIIFNEILFNPRSGGVNFVEIYNKSEKILDLKDLSLATTNAADSVINLKILSLSQLLINPHQYLVLSTDPDIIKKEYTIENPKAFLQLKSLPAFSGDAGVAVLIGKDSRIDQLNFSERMHFPLIKNTKGVSLERRNFNRPTNEPGNFRSAAASAGYATPGYKNSQYTEDNISQHEEVELLSRTFSPDNDGFEDVFILNYKFAQPGMIANASIYNDKGILVRKLTNNQTLAAAGVLTWDGLTESNERCHVGIYAIFLEVFNPDGTVKKYRKNFVLAARL